MTTCDAKPSQIPSLPRYRGAWTIALGAAAAMLCGGAADAAPAGLPTLADVRPLDIHYGVNTIPNFASDGAGATIVEVHRENGNAHSSDWWLVAIDGNPAAPGVPGVPQLVERDEPAATASRLFGIEPFDGENEIRALRLTRANIDGRPAMLMLQADRRVNEVPTLVTPTRVDLQVWRLDGPSEAIGRTPYRFVLAGRATTTRLYCNANTALNKELGMPFPDGWDNEDTPDGCAPPATQERSASALEMVRELDVTSFPNSFGPRHLPAGTNFAGAGYGVVQTSTDGWVQVRPADASWQFSLFVLEDAPDRKRLCIADQALEGGTYRTLQAIDVGPDGRGHWHATGAPQTVTGCSP